MTIRDPRSDPRPGDEYRGDDGQVRRVIQREGEMLLCESENVRYQMSVRSWQVRSGQAAAMSELGSPVPHPSPANSDPKTDPEPKFPPPDPDPEKQQPGVSPLPVREPVEPGPDVIDPGMEPLPA